MKGDLGDVARVLETDEPEVLKVQAKRSYRQKVHPRFMQLDQSMQTMIVQKRTEVKSETDIINKIFHSKPRSNSYEVRVEHYN